MNQSGMNQSKAPEAVLSSDEAPEEKTERLKRMATRWLTHRVDEVKKLPHFGRIGVIATVRNGDIVEVMYVDETTVK
jgi:hypothetical protein